MSYFEDYPVTVDLKKDNYRKVMTSDNIYLQNCGNCKCRCKIKSENYICDRYKGNQRNKIIGVYLNNEE